MVVIKPKPISERAAPPTKVNPVLFRFELKAPAVIEPKAEVAIKGSSLSPARRGLAPSTI